MSAPVVTLRPARVCRCLLAALNASDSRSRARKRDQTPDSIGLALRRALLEQAAREDPEPHAFDQWLLDHVEASTSPGAVRAIAHAVLDEWHLAHQMPSFAVWLEHGAPSDDADARDGDSGGQARVAARTAQPSCHVRQRMRHERA